MANARLRHRDRVLTVAVARDGEPIREGEHGPDAGRPPAPLRPCCWPRSSAASRRREAGSQSSGSPSASGPAPTRACGSGSPPPGRWPRPAGLQLRGGLQRSPPWPRGSRSCPTPPGRPRCPSSTRGAGRRSRRSTTRRRAAAGARSCSRPASWASSPAGTIQPAGGRGRGATISDELEAAGATVAPPGDPVHRIAARHICALGESGGRRPRGAIEPIYLREPDAKRWLERDESRQR